MDRHRQPAPPHGAWLAAFSGPVDPAALSPAEHFAYAQFLGRAGRYVLIKATLNALIVVLFAFTVLSYAPATVLIAAADGLLLIPYYFLVRRWPALATLASLTLTAVAISAADAAAGYQTFTSGVLYTCLIVAGAVLLLHPRSIWIVTGAVAAIMVGSYLLEAIGVIPVQMTLVTTAAIVRVTALHAFSCAGLGAMAGVLVRLHREMLSAHSRHDIQLALQEGFRDITANVDPHTVLQRIAERAVDILPNVDRAILMVEEGEQFVARGAAGYAPLDPIGWTIATQAMGAYLRGEPFTVTDITAQIAQLLPPETVTQLQQIPRSRATFFYPLQTHSDQRIILAVTNSRSARPLDEAETRIMDLLAHQAAVAIENARLFQTAQERLQSEIALSHIGQEIASHLDMAELGPAVHRHITQVMDAASLLIAVIAPHSDELRLLSPIDFGQVVPDQVVPGQGVLGWVVRHRRPLRFGDLQREVDAYPDIQIQMLGAGTFVPGSLLAVPLQVGDQIVGALSVQSPRPNVYDEHDEHLLTTLANHIAVAVHNAHLYAEVQRQQAELQGLIAAVSQRLQRPVEALFGFGRLLRESATAGLSVEQRDYIERLERNSQWIAQLTQDMLFLARLDEVREEVEPIALGTLVRGVATHLELERQGIAVAIQPDMPVLYADPVLLWAYVRNLLQNACRLLQGTADPRIEVGCTESPAGYRLSVQENGQALPAEQLAHAYELFFPIGGSEGAGIGLAIARHIAEHYGGRVWAAAGERGMAFHLMVPPELGVNREGRQ